MYRCQQNVYTDTTGTKTYLGEQPKLKLFDFTEFFSEIGHLMAPTKFNITEVSNFTKQHNNKLAILKGISPILIPFKAVLGKTHLISNQWCRLYR